MNESKHTPGPWVASNIDVSTAAELVGNIICEAPEAWEESMCYWKANARLIAAAPELLEALKALVECAPSNGNRCFYCNERVYGRNNVGEHFPDCELAKGKAAIAKAKGEQQCL